MEETYFTKKEIKLIESGIECLSDEGCMKEEDLITIKSVFDKIKLNDTVLNRILKELSS